MKTTQVSIADTVRETVWLDTPIEEVSSELLALELVAQGLADKLTPILRVERESTGTNGPVRTPDGELDATLCHIRDRLGVVADLLRRVTERV